MCALGLFFNVQIFFQIKKRQRRQREREGTSKVSFPVMRVFRLLRWILCCSDLFCVSHQQPNVECAGEDVLTLQFARLCVYTRRIVGIWKKTSSERSVRSGREIRVNICSTFFYSSYSFSECYKGLARVCKQKRKIEDSEDSGCYCCESCEFFCFEPKKFFHLPNASNWDKREVRKKVLSRNLTTKVLEHQLQQEQLHKYKTASKNNEWTKSLIPFKSFSLATVEAQQASSSDLVETWRRKKRSFFLLARALQALLMYCEFQWKIVNCKLQISEHLLLLLALDSLTWMIRASSRTFLSRYFHSLDTSTQQQFLSSHWISML